MSNQPVHIFASYSNLKQHVGYLPNWLSRLIQTLGNSPIQYILPKYENSQIVSHIIGYIPQSEVLKDVIEEIKNPIMAFYSHQVLSQDKSPTVVSNINNNLTICEIEDVVDKVLPTLIDVTNPNKIVIKRPGPISKSDLEVLTGKNIEIQKDYFDSLNMGQIDIFRTSTKPTSTNKTVVLGTKEKLKTVFNLDSIKHFGILETDNYFLINLGSITNPENIVRQLSKNISIAKNFGLSNIYFLENNWPANNWGEILRFIFNNIARPLPKLAEVKETQEMNHLQDLKSFVAT